MKRIFALLITISVLLPLALVSVSATVSELDIQDSYIDNQGVTYILSDDGTYYIVYSYEPVSNGSELVTDLQLADQISTIPVTTIASGCFSESIITTVKLPVGLITIEPYAFLNCKGLTEIEIPDGVTSIGVGAFYMCISLESATVSKSVNEIGSRAFAGCISLKSLAVKQGNTVYHSETNCIIETKSKKLISGCKNSVIPDGVEIIGYAAFSNMDTPQDLANVEGIKTITIPDTVTAIEEDAFWSCKQLKSINIPKNVTSIESPFGGCIDLKSINVSSENDNFIFTNGCLIDINAKTLVSGFDKLSIPDDGSVETIGYKAFAGQKYIQSVTVPSSVKNIGDSAFFMCDSLIAVDLSEGVEKIEALAFESCISLKTITIPASVKTIGDYAFEGCGLLKTITCGATQQPNGWSDEWLGNCGANVVWSTPVTPEPPIDEPSDDPSASEDPSSSEDPSASEDPSTPDDPSNPDQPIDPDQPPVEEPAPKKGDINGNEVIDSMDYVFLKRAYFGTYKLKDIAIGDINSNGVIDSMDYVFLKRAYFGTYVIK